MRVRVLAVVKTKRGTLSPGMLVDIPDDLVRRLRGRIEPIDTPESVPSNPSPADELFDMIRQTVDDLDRRGRPWTGWRASLTGAQRQKVKEMEVRIDDSWLALDRESLIAALAEYQEMCLGSNVALLAL